MHIESYVHLMYNHINLTFFFLTNIKQERWERHTHTSHALWFSFHTSQLKNLEPQKNLFFFFISFVCSKLFPFFFMCCLLCPLIFFFLILLLSNKALSYAWMILSDDYVKKKGLTDEGTLSFSVSPFY